MYQQMAFTTHNIYLLMHKIYFYRKTFASTEIPIQGPLFKLEAAAAFILKAAALYFNPYKLSS